MTPDQSNNITPDQSNIITPDQSNNITPDQSNIITPDLSNNITPDQSNNITPEMEFKEFEPRFKSAKTRFKLSAGLNLETFDTILSGTNHI